MFLTKLKTATFLVLLVAFLGAGAGASILSSAVAARSPMAKATAPPTANDAVLAEKLVRARPPAPLELAPPKNTGSPAAPGKGASKRAPTEAEQRTQKVRAGLQGTWVVEEIVVFAKPGDVPVKRKGGPRTLVVRGDHVVLDAPLIDPKGRLAGAAAKPGPRQEAVLFLTTAGADRVAREKPLLPADLSVITGREAPGPDGRRWRTMPGLLELNGDRLTVCLRVTGASRPAGLVADGRGEAVAIRLRRAKPAAQAPRPWLSPAEQFKAALAAREKAYLGYQRVYKAATNDLDRRKIASQIGHHADPETFAPRFLEIIQQSPADPIVKDALRWLCSHGSELTELALRTVAEHWMHRPELATFCEWATHPNGQEFLRRALAGSSARDVQGIARYSLAVQHLTLAKVYIDTNHPEAAKAATGAAEKLLDEVVKRYPDVRVAAGRLGDLAGDRLFPLRRLAPGQPAPKTAGPPARARVE